MDELQKNLTAKFEEVKPILTEEIKTFLEKNPKLVETMQNSLGDILKLVEAMKNSSSIEGIIAEAMKKNMETINRVQKVMQPDCNSHYGVELTCFGLDRCMKMEKGK
jgi:hypothetical protein